MIYNDNMTKTSEIKSPHVFRGSVTDLSSLELDPVSNRVSIIEIMRTGTWSHPIYGDIEITLDKLERFRENFDSEVRKAVAIDVEHKSDEGAVGWFNRVFIEKENGVSKLMGEVEWTDDGIKLIKAKKYRFFSPEFTEEYEDPSTQEEYRDVLIGGAITNRPFFQELAEIVLSEKGITSRKFIKKGGEENKMTYEELLAKLKEDAEFVPSEEDAVSEEDLAKAKAEVEVDAGDGDDEGGDEGGEDEDGEGDGDEGGDDEGEGQEGGEGTDDAGDGEKSVKMSENQFKKLSKDAEQGAKAMRKLEKMSVEKDVDSFIFSDVNKGGVLLPKNKSDVLEFTMTLGENQRNRFFEILKTLPKINMFGEIGSSEVYSEEDVPEGENRDNHLIMARSNKLMEKQPDKYKTFRDAAFEAEKQLKSENKLSENYGK